MTERPSLGQVAEDATWPASLTEAAWRDCLESFPEASFTVTGHCMGPSLRHGDVVVVRAASRRPPRVGDIVLARHPAGLRLHRLVVGRGLRGLARGLRTKADRARFLDPPLRSSDLLGTVVACEGRPLPRRPLRALASLFEAALVRAHGLVRT
jgi:Peptidase S24-like